MLNATAQVCGNIGQNPLSAFPVCGTTTFSQSSVPICNGSTVPSPSCSSNLYTDKNPYYYKFTCFQAGALHFLINPNTNSDDYDWSLYDVTNQNPLNIYTNAALTIASNWSGTGGNTGMDNSGNNQYVCEGIGRPRYSRPANLIVGHNYLLMVSHFTNSQSGYSLSFGGGTAIITDPTPPHLLTAKTNCDGKSLKVQLNKKMLCNSLTSTGSEFYITPGNILVTAASGTTCTNNFDTEELTVTLNNVLPTGNYYLHIKNGTDNNTLLDYCDKQIPITDSLPFTYTPGIPTPIDSIAPLNCAPNQVTILFTNKQIKCSTVASDGSDFSIAGTYPVSITSANTNTCNNGLTNSVTLQLSTTLYTKGTFTISLKVGSDGTTLEDECAIISTVGSSKTFSVKDTVNANFNTITKLGCVRDTILAFHPMGNEVNQWNWYINDTLNAQHIATPQFIFTQFGVKNIVLQVTNGFCTDTATATVNLDNYIAANFTNFDDNCPKEAVQFTSTAVGKNLTHFWQFGDGVTDTTTNASHIYYDFGIDKTYNVTYTITNNLGCTSSITKPVNVLKLCGEYVPTVFTPNGDGVNDSFGPLYAVKANNLVFTVYNRWGQVMYQTNLWRNAWNGKYKGEPAPTGTYVWKMQYTNRDNNKPYLAKGTVILLR